MLSIVISLSFTFSWLLSVFVLSGCIPKLTDSVLRLKSQNISFIFKAMSRTVARHLQIGSLSSSPFLSLYLMPFWFSCHRFRSSSKENFNTVIKSRLDNGSSCFVPRLIENRSLSVSVKTVPFLLAVEPLQKFHM